MKKVFSALLGSMLAGGGAGYEKISPSQAKERLEAGDVTLLDVREREEYDAGHIPGAKLLPLGNIDGDAAAAAIGGKDRQVMVYCRSGVRSRQAAAALAQLGYTRVYDLGGILAWPYEVER